MKNFVNRATHCIETFLLPEAPHLLMSIDHDVFVTWLKHTLYYSLVNGDEHKLVITLLNQLLMDITCPKASYQANTS